MLSTRDNVIWLSLLTSSATLVCCALPALLIALGAGAALAALVGAVPQLIWVSMHKPLVFSLAAVLLAVGGIVQSRPAACPLDPALAAACARGRSISKWVYALSVLAFMTGGFFAFALPWMRGLA